MAQKYSWPGNVRELRNIVERAIILETEEIIGLNSLPAEIQKIKPAPKVSEVERWFEIPDEGFSIYQIEKKIIE